MSYSHDTTDMMINEEAACVYNFVGTTPTRQN